MKYYIDAFKNYTNAKGRASRKEFWMFALLHYPLCIAAGFIDGFFGLGIVDDVGIFSLSYLLATLCPFICLQIRRLHDVGKPGGLVCLIFIPIAWFLPLYLYLKQGDAQDNVYGPAPIQHTSTEQQTSTVQQPASAAETPADETAVYRSPVQSAQANPSAPPAPGRFCRKCGTALGSAKKCPNCGARGDSVLAIVVIVILTVLLAGSLFVLKSVTQYAEQKIVSYEEQGLTQEKLIDEQDKKIEELNTLVEEYKQSLSKASAERNSYKTKAEYFDAICFELMEYNVGYASDNFNVNPGIIVMRKNDRPHTVTLTAHWPNYGNVYCEQLGSSANLAYNSNSWSRSTTLTISPKGEGVTVFWFTNDVDRETFRLIAIVI